MGVGTTSTKDVKDAIDFGAEGSIVEMAILYWCFIDVDVGLWGKRQAR